MKPKIRVTYYPIQSDSPDEYEWPVINPTLVSFIVNNMGSILKAINKEWHHEYLAELEDDDGYGYEWWTIEVYEDNYFTIVYELADIGFYLTMADEATTPDDGWIYVGAKNIIKFYLHY